MPDAELRQGALHLLERSRYKTDRSRVSHSWHEKLP
jgi:hypothetical protein